MPFQPAPNVAQVQILGSVDSQLTINNLYWEISGGGITPVNLDTLVDSIANWVNTSLAPILSEDWSFTRVIGTDLTTQTGFRVEAPGSATGGVTGEAAPNNVAACVSFRTGLAGRSYHGRNYVPAIPNAEINLNAMSPSFLSALSGAYVTLIGAGSFVPGWQWGVLSRKQAGVPLANAILTPIISVTFTSPYVRSMRSRSVGHGA